MVGTPSSSSSSASSCASFSSFDDVTVKTSSSTTSSANTIKFLCSYGGKIFPRFNDGKLRYFGGDTRVHSVDRSISYSELRAKMGELCGWGSASIRCQLPNEDLDSLVSITSDEDLANLIEEYDLASRDKLAPSKIRAFLHPTPSKSSKAPSPPRTTMTSSPEKGKSRALPPPIGNRCVHQISAPSMLSGRSVRDPRFATHHHHHHHHHQNGVVKSSHGLVHHGNCWN